MMDERRELVVGKLLVRENVGKGKSKGVRGDRQGVVVGRCQ